MRIAFGILVTLAVAVLGVWTFPGEARAASEGDARIVADRVDRDLLKETLVASGIQDPELRLRYEARLQEVLEEMGRRVGQPRSRYRLARRLFDALHATSLRRYEAEADGIDSALDRGEFNCLSASFLYGIIARAYGFDVQMVEIPRHVYVRLLIDGRGVDIETTSPRGFDLRQRLDGSVGKIPTSRYGSNSEPEESRGPAPHHSGLDDPPTLVDLERAVAFLWHNTGKRALERGESLIAAVHFLRESRLRPDLTSRSEALTALLARAFRTEYEAGHFESAYRIAEIDLEIFPGRTTARDRFLAAALKRIEGACEAGDPAEAESVLNQAGAATRVAIDLARLERGACPLIATAAVRMGDWERATRMANRFAGAQSDPVEAMRLSRWVKGRYAEATSALGKDSCTLPRPEDPFTLPLGALLSEGSSTSSAEPSATVLECPAGTGSDDGPGRLSGTSEAPSCRN